MTVMLAEDDVVEIPLSTKADLQAFTDVNAGDLLATSIVKDIGVSCISLGKIENQSKA